MLFASIAHSRFGRIAIVDRILFERPLSPHSSHTAAGTWCYFVEREVDAGATVMASDSEAIQSKPPLPTPSLDRFALLAMKECGRCGSPAPAAEPEVEPRWRVLGWL
jgi:hypothetical protein